jgi:hypothetical protein
MTAVSELFIGGDALVLTGECLLALELDGTQRFQLGRGDKPLVGLTL